MTRVLLLSGSLRERSASTAALATLAASPPLGVSTVLYDGLRRLPPFDPDLDVEPLPAEVSALRGAIGACDGIVVSSPEYAGTLPGAFKNLLDWCVGGTEISDKPVVWLNTGVAWRGHGAIATLEMVLGYVQARLVSDRCATVTIAPTAIGETGTITDPELVGALEAFLAGFVAAVESSA